MDLISKQVIEISSRALDGLAERHKALSANVANADVPEYQRVDVKFEDQLSKIYESENYKQKQKEIYSAGLQYAPNTIPNNSSNDNINKLIGMANGNYNILNPESNSYESYRPERMNSDDPPVNTNGNNVNVEYEMAELAKNGTRYAAVSTFIEREFKGLSEVIKGANA